MRTLRNPIEVRGYAMFDKFKVRGLLIYNKELKRMRISYSYGHLDEHKKYFVPSQFKEHSGVLIFEGKEFDKIDRPLSSKESGSIWEILKTRIYYCLNEKHNWFRENK